MHFKFLTKPTLGMYSESSNPILAKEEIISANMMIINYCEVYSDYDGGFITRNVPEAEWLVDLLPQEYSLRIVSDPQTFELLWIEDHKNFLEAAITNQTMTQIPSPDDACFKMNLRVSHVQQAIREKNRWLYTLAPYGEEVGEIIVGQVEIIPCSSANLEE